MSTLAFYAQFTKSLLGVNSLTVTWDVEQITRSDGTRSALVTGGATSITIGRRGLYGYLLASADTKLYDYVATAITAGDVDQKEIAALWTMYETDGLKLAGQAVTAAAGVTFPASIASPTNITAGTINSVSGTVGGIAGTITTLDVLWAKIQKWLRLGFRKDSYVATDHATEVAEINVNTGTGVGTFANTTDSLEANRDNIGTSGAGLAQQVRDAMKLAPTAGAPATDSADRHLDDLLIYAAAAEPADVWSYASRALTALPAATSDGTTPGAITRRRGDSWSISLTLGPITGYTSLWFTVKNATTDADTAAILAVKKNASGSGDGLLYVNGTTASDASKASIAVNDAATGAVTIAVDETVTDDFAPSIIVYDAQVLISGNVTTPDSGTFTITADVTRSVA